MKNTIDNFSKILLLACLLATGVTARAEELEKSPRRVIRSVPQRVTALELDPEKGYAELVHERAPMRPDAVFHADPQLIDPNAVILFQAFSESSGSPTERWRCIAVDDVAECLGAPVSIRYRPSDERVVLRLTVHHRESGEGTTLVAEAKTNKPELASASK
jgi:hypothetical protein